MSFLDLRNLFEHLHQRRQLCNLPLCVKIVVLLCKCNNILIIVTLFNKKNKLYWSMKQEMNSRSPLIQVYDCCRG